MSYYSERLKNHQEVNARKYEIDPAEHKKLEENYEKLQKLLKKEEELRSEIAGQKEELLKDKYEAYTGKIAIHYNRTDTFYDWVTGVSVKPDDYDLIIKQNTIDDVMYIPLGTDLENGAIIFGKYGSKINSQKGTLKKTFDSIIVKDVEKIGEEYYYDSSRYSDFLIKTINTYYGFEYKGGKDPFELSRRMMMNKSSEIIIKEVSDAKSADKLLDLDVETAMPINKILKLSKPMYLKMKEEDLVNLMIDFRGCVKMLEIENLFNNENEVYNFLKETKNYLSDAEFYGLAEHEDFFYNNYRRNNLLSCSSAIKSILQAFSNETVRKYYTFKKLYNYVYKEVVNQGYTNCETLISELRDYLRMCDLQGIKPNTDSSSLNILHNITSRNHKIVVKEQEEEIFKKIYENDTKIEKIDEGYMIVVPSCTNDIKQEGDSLCHCVASYIKRILDGECKIYFLRRNKDISLITFEVRDGAVVQVRGSHNRAPLEPERKAINTWAKKHELRVEY